jgi:hypothetical protein
MTYENRRKDLDAKLKILDLWLYEASEESDVEMRRKIDQALTSAISYYNERRINLHN